MGTEFGLQDTWLRNRYRDGCDSGGLDLAFDHLASDINGGFSANPTNVDGWLFHILRWVNWFNWFNSVWVLFVWFRLRFESDDAKEMSLSPSFKLESLSNCSYCRKFSLVNFSPEELKETFKPASVKILVGFLNVLIFPGP